MTGHKRAGDHIKRVGIVFSGGPAPAANAVISAAAISFLEDGRQAIGWKCHRARGPEPGSQNPLGARRRRDGRDPLVGGAHLLPVARAATAPGGVGWHDSGDDPAARYRKSEIANIGPSAGRCAIRHALRTEAENPSASA